MSVSLREMCEMVKVSYEEVKKLRPVIDSDSIEGESDREEEPGSSSEREDETAQDSKDEGYDVDAGKLVMLLYDMSYVEMYYNV